MIKIRGPKKEKSKRPKVDDQIGIWQVTKIFMKLGNPNIKNNKTGDWPILIRLLLMKPKMFLIESGFHPFGQTPCFFVYCPNDISVSQIRSSNRTLNKYSQKSGGTPCWEIGAVTKAPPPDRRYRRCTLFWSLSPAKRGGGDFITKLWALV